ncbi:MAG TPA: TonB-dependent receptor, partial [Deltaproteobacteria bacterium]|nr:TonB-dependent receptor [Deltaproteobacteria bacterium]
DVVEGSGSLFAEFEWSPFEWMTWQAGLRGDLLVFDVDTGAGLGASSNSGTDVDGLVSPKLALILRPSDTVEIYVDGGGGFHSNDARGATIRIDPTTGLRTRRVDPIARQWGSEVGLRWQPNERLHLTGVLWFLDSESELVFAGDSGTTVPQGGSRRYGVELTGFFRPFHWLAFDASFARSHAEFKGLPSGRDRIPNAIEQVVSAGVTLSAGGWAGSLRVRHFGSYPLVEDDTQRAGSTTLVHLGASYEWGPVTLGVTVLNLLDSRDNEIEYFFASRLAGEAAPVPDVHLHPVAPRQVRGTLTLRF